MYGDGVSYEPFVPCDTLLPARWRMLAAWAHISHVSNSSQTPEATNASKGHVEEEEEEEEEEAEEEEEDKVWEAAFGARRPWHMTLI